MKTVVALLGLVAVFGLTGASSADQSVEPGPITCVKMHLGRPTFFLDGKPYTRPFFATYQPHEKLYAAMAKAGFQVYLFQVALPTMWVGPDKWDFSHFDQCARNIIEADPNALIMPRIYIQAPEWWRKAHPKALMVLDNGRTTFKEPFHNFLVKPGQTFESIASPRWRHDGAAALKAIIRHIHAAPWADRIFGYQFSGLATEEWYYYTVNQETNLGDYSKPMRRAFIRWLRAKYKTKQALDASWHKPGLDFDQVKIPSREERVATAHKTFRDPATEMNVIDFYQFDSAIVADTINYFAGVIKKATHHRKVVGTYYAYLLEFRGNPDFGHNATAQILRSPNLDFILAPPGYLDRKPGGMETYRRPFLSGTLHGKLWVDDNDSVSFLLKQVMARQKFDARALKEMAMYHPEGGATAQASLWDYWRSAGFVLDEGIYESIFDLHGGYYEQPQLIEGLRHILNALDRSKNVDRTSVAQILVVVDEPSCAYMGFQMDRGGSPWNSGLGTALALFQPGFIRSGAPFDAIVASDLERVPLDRYKLIVFLNNYNMSDAQRRFVKSHIENGKRSVLWIYAPGLFDGNKTSVDGMARLTGIHIVPSPSEDFTDCHFTLTADGRRWMKSTGYAPIQRAIGQAARNCKLFSVDDPQAEVLGRQPGPNAAVFAKKDMGDWTSYYCITGVWPPELVRALAKSAGVHIYSDSDNALYVNKSYITIHAAKAGTSIITLPAPSDVYDVMCGGDQLYKNATRLNVSLMFGQTAVYRYAPAGK